MITRLQSGFLMHGSEAAGETNPAFLERDVLLVYAGSFESMDGAVEVTEDHINLLATNHNSLLSKVKRLATGDVPLKDCPPLQLDHSASAKDTVGRLIGETRAEKVEIDGKETLGLKGRVRILGRENVERVNDGRWTHLSIGADLDEGKINELTITPFPAAAHASMLRANLGKDGWTTVVSPKEYRGKDGWSVVVSKSNRNDGWDYRLLHNGQRQGTNGTANTEERAIESAKELLKEAEGNGYAKPGEFSARLADKFITDMGQSNTAEEVGGSSKIHIPRYAVWGDRGRGKPEVIETSDDLEALKRKHGVTKVVKMSSRLGNGVNWTTPHTEERVDTHKSLKIVTAKDEAGEWSYVTFDYSGGTEDNGGYRTREAALADGKKMAESFWKEAGWDKMSARLSRKEVKSYDYKGHQIKIFLQDGYSMPPYERYEFSVDGKDQKQQRKTVEESKGVAEDWVDAHGDKLSQLGTVKVGDRVEIDRGPDKYKTGKVVSVKKSFGDQADEVEIEDSEGKRYHSIASEVTKLSKLSSGNNCHIFKASDGQWYMWLEVSRGAEETAFGPFSSEAATLKFLDDNFQNPGGFGMDSSGKEKPPPNPTKRRGGSRFSQPVKTIQRGAYLVTIFKTKGPEDSEWFGFQIEKDKKPVVPFREEMAAYEDEHAAMQDAIIEVRKMEQGARMAREKYKGERIFTEEAGNGKWKAQINGQDLPGTYASESEAMKNAKEFIDEHEDTPAKLSDAKSGNVVAEKRIGDVRISMVKTPLGKFVVYVNGQWQATCEDKTQALEVMKAVEARGGKVLSKRLSRLADKIVSNGAYKGIKYQIWDAGDRYADEGDGYRYYAAVENPKTKKFEPLEQEPEASTQEAEKSAKQTIEYMVSHPNEFSKGASMFKRLMTFLTGTKKLSAEDAEKKLKEMPDDEVKALSAEADEEEKAKAEKKDKLKKHLMDRDKVSDEDADKKLSEMPDEDKEKLSKEADDKAAELAGFDKKALEDADEEEDQKESEEKHKAEKKLAAKTSFLKLAKELKSGLKATNLASKKAQIATRLSALRSKAVLTPAEAKGIKIEELAAQTDEAVESFFKAFEVRQPVIMTGQYGTVSAETASNLAIRARGVALTKECLDHMPFTRKAVGKKFGYPTDENTGGAGTAPVQENSGQPGQQQVGADEELSKAFSSVVKMMDEGRREEALKHLQEYMKRCAGLGQQPSVEPVGGMEPGVAMSALVQDVKQLQNKVTEILKLASPLLDISASELDQGD